MWTVFIGMSICFDAFAQPGTLDATFNEKGIKEISFYQNSSSDSVCATLLQPDGKLLVALVDNAGAGSAPTANAVVIRLNSNGERDNTFGLSGKVNVSVSVKNNFHHNAMALQEDGKIILAGHIKVVGNPSILCLIRLNADGSKDDSFGETARQNKTGYRGIYSNSGYTFRTVQVHYSTGTIVAAASTEDASVGNFVFTGTDQYGAIISNYGGSTNGIVSLDFGTPSAVAYEDIVRASALDQTSGAWYVTGTTRMFSSSTVRFAMLAVDAATGNYKTTYRNQGKCIYANALGTTVNDCQAICFTPDHKSILLAGSSDVSSPNMMVYKLDKTMNPDLSFSADGIEIYTIPNTTGCKALSIAAETGDKVLLGGYAITSSPVPAYIKINSATGQVDNSFGSNGTKIFIGKSTDGINVLVYLPDIDNFIAAGSFSINGSNDVIVKRIEANGDADNSYGNSSEALCFAEDAATSIEDVLPRSDGKIWACGNVGLNGAIALLNSDGSFDTSFSNTLGNDPGVQYISSFLPLPPLSINPLPNAQAYALAETSDGKLLIAGTYKLVRGNTSVTLFVLKLMNDNGKWIRDPSFGNSNDGYSTMALGNGDDYVHDMIVQPDGKILLYGYAFNLSVYYAAVTRLTDTGFIDNATFATASDYPGTYMQQFTVGTPSDPTRMQFALQPDKKIVCVAGSNNQGAPLLFAFRIDDKGIIDAAFNANASASLNGLTGASIALHLKANGSIVIGGGVQVNADKLYALVQLKPDGTLDPSFDKDGKLFIYKGYGVEAILDVHETPSGDILAVAVASVVPKYFLVMAIRVSATGELDKTFYGNGLLPVAKGFPESSIVLDGSLYIFGQRNIIEETAVGIMLKMKLGTGPVVKTTNLALANLTIQYGDKPFYIHPITNSPAEVHYSVVQGSCAKVNPFTGEVTITCATIDSGIDVMIRASQLPVSGYTADTAYANIKILKGTPRILFTNEGGEIGDTIKIAAISNSGVAPVYTQLDGSGYVQFLTTNTAKIISEGSSTVSATFAATANYDQATVTALVSGYTQIIAPDANNDEGQLIFETEVNISIDVLANDEAFTGVIVPAYTDLDPSTAVRDSVFVSPSLGLFEIDSTGIVTYTPFSGFIGSGHITYTIRDSKGVKSEPGMINVAVIPQVDIPALKATQMVTPNNDGLNEAFVIGFVDLEKENNLKIYDRNGQELFTQHNYQNDWTGKLTNGKQVENGIYYYLFVEEGHNNHRELKGAVEIRR